jgi:hypothetical protein
MLNKQRLLILGSTLILVTLTFTMSQGLGQTKASAGPQLAHMVYFKLKDNSGANRAKLVATCKLLLSDHPGTLYFAAGTLAGDLNGQANDKDFDVSLFLIFESKQAHDDYQQHPKHQKFIEENLGNLEKVRVFDSYLSPVTSTAPPKRETD